jgi:sigma-E factor negative regulatory protein RseB
LIPGVSIMGSGAAARAARLERTAQRGEWTRLARRAAVAWCASGAVSLVGAQIVPGAPVRSVGPPERSVAEWLVRVQQAARIPSYVGTFVVSSASGAMSSARIWHACEGDAQLERVDALSGAPRSTFRRNDSVTTFLPQARTVRLEQREQGGEFPSLLVPGKDFSTADYYQARQLGQGRVAGFDADIVQLDPRDGLRFGYRIWSEKRTGLVVKTQTLDDAGRVLEQAAFSELQLDAPVQAAKLRQMMSDTEGYRVERVERTKTTPEAEGWALPSAVAGFKPQNCYRQSSAAAPRPMVQWIFSDGLATVSLFLEPFNAKRHAREGVSAMGATHTLTRRIVGRDEQWWVTAVGEVPAVTLKAFADGLERRP